MKNVDIEVLDVDVHDQYGKYRETFSQTYIVGEATDDLWFVNRFRNQNVGLVCWRREKGTFRTIALEWLGDMCLVGLGTEPNFSFYVIPIHLDNTRGQVYIYVEPRHFSYREGDLKDNHLFFKSLIEGKIIGREQYWNRKYLVRVSDYLGRWILVGDEFVND